MDQFGYIVNQLNKDTQGREEEAAGTEGRRRKRLAQREGRRKQAGTEGREEEAAGTGKGGGSGWKGGGSGWHRGKGGGSGRHGRMHGGTHGRKNGYIPCCSSHEMVCIFKAL